MKDGTYAPLDSVRITNTTNNWTETLYGSDTTLGLFYMVNSINDITNASFAVAQNIPNPFNGNTFVPFQLAEDEQVEINLYDLSGKQCASYSGLLESGAYNLNISVASAQVYIMQVKTASGMQSLKLLSESGAGTFSIVPEYADKTALSAKVRKAETNNAFTPGNAFVYTGYCTYNGEVKNNRITATKDGNDETVHFTMPIGYAVGDVYYNNAGVAEGVVWWIADTIAIIENIPYGQHGRIISLDEGEHLQWGPGHSKYPTYARDSVDGRPNTAKLMQMKDTLSDDFSRNRIQAAPWCVAKGEGWYLPAVMELVGCAEVREQIRPSFQGIGTPIFHDWGIYWSSTAEVNGSGWEIYAYTVYCWESYIITPTDQQGLPFKARAMKWF
jgi:hypothetical protein